ncbi:uncharacterized protein LOC128953820 [Oppia nitens]|uniref:uncharacterized protein LOC128953820 n=1 Tax=Oppia nitens TaxID=1686743 RepID=UPI0023DAB5BB|nr:uncharacterized protein LOC128953820 [Oppia nitens]
MVDSYDRSYIIMDLADYGSLDQYVNNGLLTCYTVHKIFWDLCAGLKYLHYNHIVHYDIGLQNVLIFSDTDNVSEDPIAEQDGQQQQQQQLDGYNIVAKWADFGVSRQYTTSDDHLLMKNQFGEDVANMCQMIHWLIGSIKGKSGIDCFILKHLVDHLKASPIDSIPDCLNLMPYLETNQTIQQLFSQYMASPELEFYRGRHFIDILYPYATRHRRYGL